MLKTAVNGPFMPAVGTLWRQSGLWCWP